VCLTFDHISLSASQSINYFLPSLLTKLFLLKSSLKSVFYSHSVIFSVIAVILTDLVQFSSVEVQLFSVVR